MAKFDLPKEFKVQVSEANIKIVIPEYNPIWVGFYAVLGLGCGWLSYAVDSVCLYGVLFFVLLILNQLRKKTVCYIDGAGFSIQKERFEFEDIKSIRRSVKGYEIGNLANRGDLLLKKIAVETGGKTRFFGKRMIDEYQKATTHILQRMTAKDEQFKTTWFP